MRVLAVMHARYAYRARNIRNTPVVNIDKQSERLLAMRRLVRSLQVRVVGWACTRTLVPPPQRWSLACVIT